MTFNHREAKNALKISTVLNCDGRTSYFSMDKGAGVGLDLCERWPVFSLQGATAFQLDMDAVREGNLHISEALSTFLLSLTNPRILSPPCRMETLYTLNTTLVPAVPSPGPQHLTLFL